ncbi:hypothetical protein WR25_13224 [Diploscapter pachys]|uniref:Uncharacterized protein n=1 Tax=Diploscapter pachys TaxID=2018661 RepID=A0A2A2KDB8_9BILA|nr:hypothetical protein WR25_13224 [Diploscapter pachys]
MSQAIQHTLPGMCSESFPHLVVGQLAITGRIGQGVALHGHYPRLGAQVAHRIVQRGTQDEIGIQRQANERRRHLRQQFSQGGGIDQRCRRQALARHARPVIVVRRTSLYVVTQDRLAQRISLAVAGHRIGKVHTDCIQPLLGSVLADPGAGKITAVTGTPCPPHTRTHAGLALAGQPAPQRCGEHVGDYTDIVVHAGQRVGQWLDAPRTGKALVLLDIPDIRGQVAALQDHHIGFFPLEVDQPRRAVVDTPLYPARPLQLIERLDHSIVSDRRAAFVHRAAQERTGRRGLHSQDQAGRDHGPAVVEQLGPDQPDFGTLAKLQELGQPLRLEQHAASVQQQQIVAPGVHTAFVEALRSAMGGTLEHPQLLASQIPQTVEPGTNIARRPGTGNQHHLEIGMCGTRQHRLDAPHQHRQVANGRNDDRNARDLGMQVGDSGHQTASNTLYLSVHSQTPQVRLQHTRRLDVASSVAQPFSIAVPWASIIRHSRS